MSYLERNRAVVRELRRLWLPQTDQPVTSSSTATKTLFTSMGSFNSPTLGREVFVGMKSYQSPSDTYLILPRAPEELATITAIAEHLPDYRDLLPQFYVAISNFRGKKVGLLMEDFSEGGKHEVYNSSYVPDGVVNLFGKDALEEDFVSNMAFNVGGELKLGDFFPFFKMPKRLALARFPMDQALAEVTRSMRQHTMRLAWNLQKRD